jgi:hypothetical protein
MKFTVKNAMFFAAIILSGNAYAQTKMYKCGNTFSQTPCAADAKEIEVKAADPCDDQRNRYSSACIGRPLNIDKEMADAKKKAFEKLPDNPPPAEVVEANKQLCQRGILSILKDPESARIRNVRRSGPVNHYYDGKWTAGGAYYADVNAKNSYGAFTGEDTFTCAFSMDERTLVRVYKPGSGR